MEPVWADWTFRVQRFLVTDFSGLAPNFITSSSFFSLLLASHDDEAVTLLFDISLKSCALLSQTIEAMKLI